MIQKMSPSLRRPSTRSSSGSSNIPQSPSVRSTSSFSNLTRNSIRSTSNSGSQSISASSTRSNSPLRSVSAKSDPFLHPGRIRIRRSDSINNNSRKNDTYTGSITVTIRPKPRSVGTSHDHVGLKSPRYSQPRSNSHHGSNTFVRDPWFITNDKTIVHEEIGEFKFDHVFASHCTNLEVYERTSKPMIDKLLMGFNATIFAYGMTGSGKTFTMSGNEQELGLIPLSVSYLFTNIMEQSMNGDKKFDVIISYLEIYNERIYDLLESGLEESGSRISTPSRLYMSKSNSNGLGVELKIRDDSQYGVKVIGLTERRCESSEELLRWIAIGDKSRKIGETDYNARSSRSHAIVLIRLTSTDVKNGTSRSSTLSLCDLAGSERATGQQERRKEGSFINKSLLALGTVISKLSADKMNSVGSNIPSPSASGSSSSSGNATNNGTSPSNHIPYRDSKLTRLLQPALSGDSIVTTICTVDTRNDAAAETMNTLRFASRAKNVALHVSKKSIISNGNNDGDKDRTIELLRRQLEEQRRMISELKNRSNIGEPLTKSSNESTYKDIKATGNDGDPNLALMRAENRVLKYKLENCEKLLDKDVVDLQDSEIMEIVEMLPFEVGTLLETKFQGLESQIRQYRKYTQKLEDKIMALEKSGHTAMSLTGCDGTEVIELQKMLERKDKMIEALQSAKRLRDRALKPLINTQQSPHLVVDNDK
ncbi:CLL_HP2_G0047610.mRNA.1.CDS.1 [Saccharomyces cerevisiae]|uniref:Kinesin-like protein n=1 Tax=Saccharomyces cerevisiae (strain Kyokai no. 7 / NBRC 101557) TaxID=721032 RepID=G2WP27_YEASK|nr:CLL_HP2_G0047610.mRNA.1.CDS.1 [Saccharomyces cerevisiae]GAA26820.1 K7_Kip2p [Saccharomyces cerevisiae Kyokai no. 7]CAI5331556.1 CMF_HP2_G0049330.mRNA.1.CDS.1 [Saccharomyces cerevisiae]CAI6683932.1 CLL_HP2_G0047610.mRNA.1.CDS.1 [Saccharomyces cerevisiae]CAI6772410.1 CMF_HP2_G0049330.mRNA.1.CDS.1 [Saccharomyces cerevisiae]